MDKKTNKILIRVLKEHHKTLNAMKKDENFRYEANKNPKIEKHVDSTIEDVEFLLKEFK